MRVVVRLLLARTTYGYAKNHNHFGRFAATCTFLILLLLAVPAPAAVSCKPAVGALVSVEGRIEVQRDKRPEWLAARLNETLCQGDTVRAGERSRATVQLINQAVLRIDQNTAMRLDKITSNVEERSLLNLVKGAFQSFSRKPRGFEVSTPYLNGSIEGTEFVFRVEADESILTVLEGTVLASNAQGSASVSGGESVAAKTGQSPQSRTLVRPRDAAQWSLYYPPILAAAGEQESGISPALRQAAADLSVGRVDAARSSVDQVINTGTGAGLAYALRAVINVVQNQRELALADGNQAVSLSPDSAAAKIALSYAQQGNFQINAARDTLQLAVAQQPQDALAWARLAELELMLGNRAAANAAASQAVSLAPDLGRTQITRGFAALAEFRHADARAAFERGIELDSADPMPHLGLGLSKISAGDLEAGRRDIEVAVGLDSNNPLLRAYLGKAYFEEQRTPLDGEQFEIAKQFDPLDPTAYLYAGIAKQTENRPVEALQDLQASIARNDNRAVYRSRLLLDKDRAARGTSLARIYSDLGFSQLGINNSTESLELDPANASAHRFLSDSYRTGNRQEVARVSELLQAQMLQDININPIQPSISATNLNIVTQGGPASAGFNEFTPLFERNKAKLDLTLAAGNNDTVTGEAVASGVYDRLSLSAGAFKYETDGFRANNDLEHEIYDLYGQFAISPAVNLQLEFGSRNTDRGDLAMKFDPVDFDPTFRRSLESDSARLGLRLTPSTSSNVLLSVISTDRDIEGTQKTDLSGLIGPGFFSRADVASNDETLQYDAQYIYQGTSYNVVAGGAYTDVDRKDIIISTFETPFGNDPPFVALDDSFDIKDGRVYTYAYLNSPAGATWTVGANYTDYERGTSFDFDELSPKLGLRWPITESLGLRGAYFEGVKPVLSSNRTLEPTQVAGFNQYFDDANGTQFKRYGIGLDWQVNPDISLGAEFSQRDLDWPTIDAMTGDGVFEDRDEDLYRTYAYWTLSERWAVNAELAFDKFENKTGSNLALDVPLETETWRLPLTATYFHPTGLFGRIAATYVDQEVKGDAGYLHGTGNSDFTLVDLAVGYRLPGRMGIASLAVQNLLDRDFDYLDDSYRVSQDEPTIGPYVPESSIMARITLNF